MAAMDKLTDTAIRASKPRTKPYKLFDGGGLYLIVNTDGSRYWRVKYRMDGAEKLISAGVYPETPLKTARKRRDDARRLIAEGLDPSEKRKEEKAARRSRRATRLDAVAKEWLAKKSRGWAESNRVRIARRLENDVFPYLGNTSIAELTGEKILETLHRVEERGAIESAHRIRQYLDSICRYAIRTHRLKVNPVPHPEALSTAKKTSFASITDPKSVGALIRAIRGYQGTLVTQVGLKLAPLLFVRPGELRMAEWSEFDLEEGEWRIPAEKMKMRAPHVVPLSSQALALLHELRPLTGTGKYLFPSERSRARPMSANTLNAALRALGYAKGTMTTHGFRHMASTLLNESGKWNRDAIERQLAHADQDEIRGTYNYAEYLPERRRMMQWWSDRIDALAAAQNVLLLKANG